MAKKRAFGKEVKIGMTLIGVLLVTFGVLLVRRMMSTHGAAAPDLAEASVPDSPVPATFLRPAPEADSAGAAAMTGASRPGPRSGGYEEGAPPGLAFSPPEAIAAAAYEQTEEPPPATTGQREPFLRAQEDSAGNGVPATLDAAPAANDDPAAAPIPLGADALPATAAAVEALEAQTPPPADPGATPLARPPADERVSTENASPAEFVDHGPTPIAGQGPGEDNGRFQNNNPDRLRRRPPSVNEADSQPLNEPAGQPANQPYGRPSAADTNSSSNGANDGYVAPAVAVAAEPGKYVVQPNDNYWTICEKVYGAGAFFKALQRHNSADQPRNSRLQVGDVILCPPASVLRRQYPDLCPKPRREQAASQVQPVSAGPRGRAGAPVYVVEQGDSLFDIARHQLGKASRWVEIYDLNRAALGDDFDYLRPGTELVMPTDRPAQSEDAVTRQRGDSIQR